MVDAMHRVDILVVDIHHPAHVPGDADDVDCNHNVHREDEVVVVRGRTCVVVVVDNTDCDDVALRRPAYVVVPMPGVWRVGVVPYRRAYAYHCSSDVVVLAWDTPCDAVAV